MPERIVVSNTSPLQYLHQVGHLDLLKRLYGEILVPPAVQEELRAGGNGGGSRSQNWMLHPGSESSLSEIGH
jgi:predicted nucleic acid-binding protein